MNLHLSVQSIRHLRVMTNITINSTDSAQSAEPCLFRPAESASDTAPYGSCAATADPSA